MRRDLKLKLVSHTGHNYLFHELCEDVEMIIRGLRTRHSTLVVEMEDHNLVLR